MAESSTSSQSYPKSLIKDYGFSDDMNPRFRKTMEDAHIFVNNVGPDGRGVFFAVYDGHGGTEAVTVVKDALYQIFSDLLRKKPHESIHHLLAEAFALTDKKLEDDHVDNDGTTAAVIYMQPEIRDGKEVVMIYSANCGDARSVLISGGQSHRLSLDHKPTLPTEIERIEEAGGLVVLGRVSGVLAVSRALGDHVMKQFVISDPFVSEAEVKEGDAHIVVACDGLWDVVSDETAAGFISSAKGNCQSIAENLVKYALDLGSTDNISVMVVAI
ncbi:putative Protein phosphatase 2C [Monocercomonoides exilis]|uniref:putative Protein phosphatase 2C n=1 Tax=Monocercomonoides exilis TaxID=2049356 RepID=UPI00355A1957|nr:putative Protein phosphatase 2C [Monocercomonoides exilis]|eukprot:MONOS_11237.1-p1 / transcript=MONOS_11237.1 / gene=MONOS_11237 / organism=Monocercomonoides_exilis_PA203 / gene_product=protein phosphatase / transcript_product=protein phosphatase / location=Mono_scaffold00553:13530-14924(-) / protein_length=271 / sequence_SO=supercontig / SO=protein_coding / is_pseudo=false